MLIKAAVIYTLVRLTGAKQNIAIQTASLLSQSGEFGFVMFGAATASEILDKQTGQFLIIVIAFSMVLTPFVAIITNTLLEKFYKPKIQGLNLSDEYIDRSQEHVILAGFGRIGARIGAILSASDVPYIALDMDEKRVKTARAQGFPVFYGDASNMKVLRSAGAGHAKMIVVSLDNPNNINRMVPLMRQYFPKLPIHARAINRQHCADLISNGVTTTISETLETSLRLSEEVLLGTGISEIDAEKVINAFRDDYYQDVVLKVTENKVVMGELRH
jgi:voltage-gated potassium channel Kch